MLVTVRAGAMPPWEGSPGAHEAELWRTPTVAPGTHSTKPSVPGAACCSSPLSLWSGRQIQPFPHKPIKQKAPFWKRQAKELPKEWETLTNVTISNQYYLHSHVVFSFQKHILPPKHWQYSPLSIPREDICELWRFLPEPKEKMSKNTKRQLLSKIFKIWYI